MSTEAQKRAWKKYQDNSTVRYTLKLNRNTDADLIRMLEDKNKNAIIKEALRLKLESDK